MEGGVSSVTWFATAQTLSFSQRIQTERANAQLVRLQNFESHQRLAPNPFVPQFDLLPEINPISLIYSSPPGEKCILSSKESDPSWLSQDMLFAYVYLNTCFHVSVFIIRTIFL